MSHIWIDLWSKRVWLAIEVEGISLPYEVVPRVNLMKELKKLIKNREINFLVIWNPIWVYSQQTKQSEKVMVFVDKLKKEFPRQKIILEDERYTTIEARYSIWDNEWFVDDISASIILASYLDKIKK